MYENTCLKGLRVLDVTKYLAGPTTCQILSDMGAEVWKIERIGTGDDGRAFAPFIDGESGWYHAFNRNKHSITLNYTKPEGLELFYELVKECDVLIENSAAGVMQKYKIDYDTVVKINPSIVYGSISGYGQKDSPYVNYPALDGCAQAFGGLISMNGQQDQPGGKVGPGAVDEIAGYMCAIGVLGALVERGISGKGQHVDVAMADACLNFNENAVTYASFTGENMPRCGNGHIALGMTGCYDTLEGKSTFYMNIPSDKFAYQMLDIIGHPELKENKAKDNASRRENWKLLDELINEYTSQFSRDEIIAKLREMRVPCAPVNTIMDCMADEHFKQRGSIAELTHPRIGKYAVTMTPFKFSRTPFREPVPAEDIGQSNALVYQGVLKKTDAELESLKAQGVI
ncbi:MAG: CaiB/BaiF CoA-transferase family protein [Christensenella sp.]|uniref:CaiB/BaiF CoA transferase family protein n=1 Tax=Christensenella sp. TaxID=1935934 RepID=UPI002B21E6FE|nr:CaiB/BaiF CoA-transferase family protein [Christensenella sp.]MEA5002512.1 CaiB/BaiF CoA-transferase family protein [Christensenella sp.]